MRTALPSFKGTHKEEDEILSVVIIRQRYLMAVSGRQVKVGCKIANGKITRIVRIHAVPPLGQASVDLRHKKSMPILYTTRSGRGESKSRRPSRNSSRGDRT